MGIEHSLKRNDCNVESKRDINSRVNLYTRKIGVRDMDVKPKEGEGLSLVGFRINSTGNNPDIFTIIVYNGKDSPVLIDNQIAFISKIEHVSGMYDLLDDRVKALGPPPIEVDLVCDIPETLHHIKHKDKDEAAIILNCLNTFFDLLNAVEVNLPDEYQSVLYDFADHLTFNREFTDFIAEQNIARNLLVDAVTWCVGAITVKAKLII